MRTLIRDGWIVAHGEEGHTLVRDGVVIVDDDKVTNVVAEYADRADVEIDAAGKLVSPGLIDTHVHLGLGHKIRLIADSGRKDLYGQPFLEFAFARPGANAPDARHDDQKTFDDRANLLTARYVATELLRNGVTTFVDVGSAKERATPIAAVVAEMGTRAYLGPGFGSESFEGLEGGRWRRVPTKEGGEGELREAVEFIEEFDGAADDRIRGILVPEEIEYCSVELLERTVALKDDLGVPVQIHAAYSPLEWQHIVETHGCTPIELLERVGLLGPQVIIGHGNLVAENPGTNWADGRDLEILGGTGTTVAHSPVNLFRRGRSLDSLTKYMKAGVNISLGADTYPRDLILQMRLASYVCKVLERDFTAAAGEMFEAATLGGARALGRDDLGRIAPGAKADIAIIALRAPDSLRYGVIRDPISALVDCGIGDDVETVMVDGKVVMRDRVIPNVDLDELLDEAQEEAQRYWERRARVASPRIHRRRGVPHVIPHPGIGGRPPVAAHLPADASLSRT